MKLTFDEFCAKVNDLNRIAVDKINNEVPPRLFGAKLHVLSASYLRHYYNRGMTPKAAYKEISTPEYIPCA